MSEKRRDNKGRILRTGEVQRPDGKYMFRYTDNNGNRQTVYSWKLVGTDKIPAGKRNCEALRDIEKQIQKDLDDDIRTRDANSMTVDALFEQFMSMRLDLKPTSRNNYRCLYRIHVQGVIGSKSLRNVRFSTIQTLYADMLQSDLKYSTVEKINAILFQMFELAVKDNVIRLNPVNGVMKDIRRLFDSQKVKRHALTKREQERLVDFVYHAKLYQRWANLITVLLGTGLRIGEALGLTWDDCDFVNEEIIISHALLYKDDEEGKYHYRISTTKTPAGMRVIPMLPEVRDALLRQKEKNMHLRRPAFSVDGYTGFIFLNNEGKVFTPGSFYTALQNITNAYNRQEFIGSLKEHREPCFLPKFSAHILRHTFCTRYCEVESDLKTIQEIMGHKNFRTTMDVYNEATAERKSASFKSMEGKFKLA